MNFSGLTHLEGAVLAPFLLPYLLHLWLGTAPFVVIGQPLNADVSYGGDDDGLSCDEASPHFKFKLKVCMGIAMTIHPTE